MANYPTTFSERPQPLVELNLGDRGNKALAALRKHNLEVVAGLTPFYAGALGVMAVEPHIELFCPNDLTRFGAESDVREWQAAGRATFILLETVEHVSKPEEKRQIAIGWGWMGAKTSRYVPGAEDTFAIRIGSRGRGKGAAHPFTESILAAAAILYDARKPWLEAWGGNPQALKPYAKAGFEVTARVADRRPLRDGLWVPDERVYAVRPPELSPAA